MNAVLVTGANKGIGLAVVHAILEEQQDVAVILGSRDADRGAEAAKQLLAINSAWQERLNVMELDVASDESVTDAEHELASKGIRLQGLVNNAGMGSGELEPVLNVNLYGIRLCFEAFKPLLEVDARVVNVTSASGPNFVTNCDAELQRFFTNRDISWESLDSFAQKAISTPVSEWPSLGAYSGSYYGISKALANALNMCLARENPDLVINACTPGFIATDLGKEFLGGRSPADAGMKEPKDGARVIMKLLFEELPGSGDYYGSDGLRSPLDRYRAPGSPEYIG